jgi:ferredoxin
VLESPGAGVGSKASGTWLIEWAPSGARWVAEAVTPLLLSAEAAGIALASSCRNGTCRTCLCRLRTGQVAYDIEWPGLSAEEKSEGWILPCVALPRSDCVLDALPVSF